MTKEIIHIGSVPIEVNFKPIKNLHLSVYPPDGRVTISSPEEYDLEKVKVYASTKLNWIKQEKKKIRNQKRESPRLYVNRESHYVLGQRYLLKVKESDRNYVEEKGRYILLNVTEPDDFDLKEKTIQTYHREILRLKIDDFIKTYIQKMNLEKPTFQIRKMKTKWGSCNGQSQRLIFNLELVKKPLDCIEYIVVHELIHLKERYHNKRFVVLMNKHFPNWQLTRKKLNELPVGI